MIEKVKKIIKREVKGEFESTIILDDVIDTFLYFVKYPLNDSSANLDGLETRLFNSIVGLLEQGAEQKDIAFAEFVKFEPYLRKILYFVDRSKLITIEAGRKGLFPLIKALNLNPESKDISTLTPDILKGENHQIEHLCRAYHLRNKESHHCINFSQLELALNIQSILVVYLYATLLYMDSLNKIIDIYGINKYLKKEINNFIQWKESFVHIDGKEFFDIDIYARELYYDEVDFIERQGTIDDLRHSIDEKQMVILGEVGMGKSTTLQYLHYKDAELCYSDNSKQIPIYLELKYIEENESITNRIISKLGFNTAFVEDFLRRGRFNIFLDGLNEIDTNIRSKIYKQIEKIIYEYPSNQIIITSRPLSYNREFDNNKGQKIPIFLLQLMAEKQIEEFLDKNGLSVKNKILEEISFNSKLREIVTSPLLLKMLIEVVQRTNTIPNNKSLIIREFISYIFQREKKIVDLDIELVTSFLKNWAYQSRELTNSNSGLSQDNIVIPFFYDLKEKFGKANFDIWDFLKKIRDIHLLTKENNLLSFTHELYQEYFAAEFLYDKGIGINNIVNLEKIINDSSWEEVIILYTGIMPSPDERIKLIKDIAIFNPFLGLKCEKSSTIKNNEVESFIISLSKKNIETKKDKLIITSSIQALIGLEQYGYVIEYVKEQKGADIPIIKSIVYTVLKANIEYANLWSIIKIFLEANPNYYIADVNKFISDNQSKITINPEFTLDIIKILITKNVNKFRHVINFLKLLNLDTITNISIDDSYVLNNVIKSNNIHDILYFIKLFNKEISSVQIIQKIIREGETSSLFMLTYYMNLLQKNLKVSVIKDMLNSDIDTRIIVGLMFIKKYELKKEFRFLFTSKSDYSKVYYHVEKSFKQYNIDVFSDFIIVLTATNHELKFINQTKVIDQYLHKKLICRVITEFPYHYLLNINGIHKTKILLSKNEVENYILKDTEKKKLDVYITHVDRKRNRLYASLKDQNSFLEEYQYILKENDIFECRINISEIGRYYLDPQGLGNRVLRFRFDQSKDYVHTRKYKAIVRKVIDYDIIECDIIDN